MNSNLWPYSFGQLGSLGTISYSTKKKTIFLLFSYSPESSTRYLGIKATFVGLQGGC